MVDNQTKLCRRDSEHTALSCNTKVARNHQLCAGPKRWPIDGRNRGNRHVGETAKCGHERFHELAIFDAAEIGTRTKRWRGTSEHETSRVCGEHIELRLTQRQECFVVNGIAPLGTIESDQGDLIVKCEMHCHRALGSTMLGTV
jgi:hypothetical protein